MRRMIRWLLVVVMIAVMSCGVYAEPMKEAVLPGIGVLKVPVTTEVSRMDMSGIECLNLVADDGGAYRSVFVFGITEPVSGKSEAIDLKSVAEDIRTKITSGPDTKSLRAGSFRQWSAGEVRAAVEEYSILTSGIACNIEVVLAVHSDRLQVVAFMTPDGDRGYWQPLRKAVTDTLVK